jgi:hypothetical protein
MDEAKVKSNLVHL